MTTPNAIRHLIRPKLTRSACYFLNLVLGTLLLCLGLSSYAQAASEDASELFEQYRDSVFQVRTIDVASGDKASIGSGFVVSGGEYIATNFHVVSLKVHASDVYRLELVRENGETLDARIVAIDVVHDLALLSTDANLPRGFRFKNGRPDQGQRIFSLGNPQDLGMTIIEGNYNGRVQKSRYEKILFSGSLNSGMSGGPAMDSRGRLLGINVAKGGEQLSFLIPANKLTHMIDNAGLANFGFSNKDDFPTPDFQAQIRKDLHADQGAFYGPVIDKPWSSEPFGELDLPQSISDSLKCWGHTIEDDDVLYESFHQHCESTDTIYISDDFSTGRLSIEYEWLNTEELNPFQFYSALENRFTHVSLSNVYSEKEVSEFDCTTQRVALEDHRWKMSSCMRSYNEYHDLYDALFMMVSLDHPDRAALIKAGASGISRKNAKALFQKLIGSVEWKR